MSRRITALNSMGVRSLQRGYFCDAILSFRHAILELQALVTRSDSSAWKLDDSTNLSERRMPLFRSQLEFFQETKIRDVSPHNIFEIYPYAFVVPTSRSHLACEMPFELSVVLLFNLGLAHHLAGLLGQENAKGHLVQARNLYKRSMAIFHSCKEESNFDLCFCSLLCGICTNIGHILSHLGYMKEAISCGDYLNAILESPTCSLDLSAEECEYFYTLTYSLQHCGKVAPAA